MEKVLETSGIDLVFGGLGWSLDELDTELEAMEELLRTGVPFEINTGAMYRGLRTEPYPSYGLLKELQKRGGEIVLSSDSHDCNSIGFAFGEVAQACREFGFRYTKIWTPEGMKEIPL